MSSVNQLSLPTYIASGNIRPARILTTSSGTARSCAEATAATAPLLGVAKNSAKFSPSIYDGSVYAYIAVANDPVPYDGLGQVSIVVAGDVISDLNKPVTSDSAGRAVTVTPIAGAGTVNYTLGYPLATAAAAGDLIPVLIRPEQITV